MRQCPPHITLVCPPPGFRHDQSTYVSPDVNVLGLQHGQAETFGGVTQQDQAKYSRDLPPTGDV